MGNDHNGLYHRPPHIERIQQYPHSRRSPQQSNNPIPLQQNHHCRTNKPTCYDPPTFFFPPQPPPAAPAAPAVPIPHVAPVAPPVAAPPPPAPASQYRPPSPMQVDPVDVPLPTPSTASASTPDHPMLPPPGALASPHRPLSPRMLEIISQFQQQAITPEYGRSLPRIQNPEVDDLRHALADMFGLPPLPLPLPAPAGPAMSRLTTK